MGEGVLASRAGGAHLAGAASPSARTTTDERRAEETAARRAVEGRAAQARLAERHREVCIFFWWGGYSERGRARWSGGAKL